MTHAAPLSDTARDAILSAPRFDSGVHHRARIGFVVIPNEQTIEHEMLRHLPAGVGGFFARASMPREISTDSLAQVRDTLATAAARILPDDGLDVVAFACTSGTVAVGEAETCAELARGAPGARATSLAGSVRKALTAMDLRRVVLGSPYIPELNDNVARFLSDAGIEVLATHGMGLNYDTEMIRVAPDYIFDFAGAIDRPDADAVLLSCGALRSIEVVDRLEQHLGKPVICSNQAMLWDVLRLAGIEDRLPGLGQLLQDH
ncbi:Arylmalonate decarboxylase [Roseovarius sp. THAF9]|uniref:maleate cis-trans isomerase family protein n=1 Tax=Roseovarius sp. THAF9 TaxID=2587847 RepID=UPI0012681711|nr:arylmalonate decarboxylase [Roseovarius sp. THAF9]QFT94182.1 Arylmalonate decarboxylase [Roseovarius sp. THAF9]